MSARAALGLLIPGQARLLTLPRQGRRDRAMDKFNSQPSPHGHPPPEPWENTNRIISQCIFVHRWQSEQKLKYFIWNVFTSSWSTGQTFQGSPQILEVSLQFAEYQWISEWVSEERSVLLSPRTLFWWSYAFPLAHCRTVILNFLYMNSPEINIEVKPLAFWFISFFLFLIAISNSKSAWESSQK